MSYPKIGCILMAAGNATRFGSNKLTEELDGKSLIRRAMEAVPSEALQQVVVVTQYPEIRQLAADFGFACVENQHPDWGISHTIQLGLEALTDCDAALFMVSDQPMLQRENVRAMVDFYRQNPEHIVGMSYQGQRGNPCIFPREFFPALLELEGDTGGNRVIRRHEDRLLCFECPSIQLEDVDSEEALQALRRKTLDN